jgi:hypothetical protein
MLEASLFNSLGKKLMANILFISTGPVLAAIYIISSGNSELAGWLILSWLATCIPLSFWSLKNIIIAPVDMESYETFMQPLVDGFINERPEFIYAIAVDNNGYAPAHHRKVSAPIKGDFSVDNVKSRHRRIFNSNRAEIRRASHTEPFLLQTFIRDTGEVLNDLSIPLYIDGRHWGSLIMGFNPSKLLDEKA